MPNEGDLRSEFTYISPARAEVGICKGDFEISTCEECLGDSICCYPGLKY